MSRQDRWRAARDARNYSTASEEDDSVSSDGDQSDFSEEGNQENNMDPQGLGQIFAALTEAVQVGNANNAVLINILNQQHEFQQQQAERAEEFRQQQRRLRLDATAFPPFDDSGTEAQKMRAFIAWEKGVRNTLQSLDAVNRMPMAAISAAVLSAFRGKALEKVTTLSAADYADVNGLMTGLRTLFCGAAMREVSYNLFNTTEQEDHEDVNTWWTRIQSLWLQAFEEADRSLASLIRRFIEGLRDHELQKRLVTRENGLPNNYEEIRDLALQISGQLDTAKMLKKDKRAGNFKLPQGRGTPMDTNAVNQGGKKNGGMAGMASGNDKPAGNQGGRPKVEKNQCHRCKGYGHWKNECPNKKKGFRNGGNGSVGHVEPGEEEESGEEDADEDDSNDWVGCAELSSGNSKGQA